MVRSPNPSSRIRRPCLLLLLFIITCSLSVVTAAQNDSDVQLLEPGKATERQLAGGETHSYRLLMPAGQYARAVVNQQGIDVMVTLFNFKTTGLRTGSYVLIFTVSGDPMTHGIRFQIK